jgi:hypothetical protein
MIDLPREAGFAVIVEEELVTNPIQPNPTIPSTLSAEN